MRYALFLAVALWLPANHASAQRLVVDLFPGVEGSTPDLPAVLGDRIVFVADDGVHGRELFVSDGTEAGTRLIADLAPGPASSNPASLVAAGPFIYFQAFPNGSEPETYRTDGFQVEHVASGVSALSGPVKGGVLIVRGPAGSSEVRKLSYGGEEGVLSPSGWHSPLGGNDSLQLLSHNGHQFPNTLVSDGTAEGTLDLLLTALQPVVSFRDGLFFRTLYGGFGSTDGTLRGSRILSLPRDLDFGFPHRAVAGSLFFSAYDHSRPMLCSLDAEFRIVALDAGILEEPGEKSGEVNGRFLFRGSEPGPLAGKVFGTDGRRVSLLTNLAFDATYFVPAGREGYFLVRLDSGPALLRTDGTPAGTIPVTPPAAFLSIDWLVRAGDRLYFRADDGVHGAELWSLEILPSKSSFHTVKSCPLLEGALLERDQRRTIPVEGLCGVPAGARSVSLEVTGSSGRRIIGRFQVFASGAVPPGEAHILFPLSRSAPRVKSDLGPEGITVWNDGPETMIFGIRVIGYEEANSRP